MGNWISPAPPPDRAEKKLAASEATNRISWSSTLCGSDADFGRQLGVDQFQPRLADGLQQLVGDRRLDEELHHDRQIARQLEKTCIVTAMTAKSGQCAKRRAAGDAESLRRIEQPFVGELAVMAAGFGHKH